MTTPSPSFWTEPQAASEAGCTPVELQEVAEIVSRGWTTSREFRAARFELGDWLVAKYGPTPKTGARSGNETHIDALARRLKRSSQTLRKARTTAERWRDEQRQRVLASPVDVSFTVMHLVTLGNGTRGDFDHDLFDQRVDLLLDTMAAAEENDVLEVTEADYLKAVRKAAPPSRRPGAQTERKAIVSTLQQFEAHQPEARTAVLSAVKADEEATRTVAAAYLMRRPELARAVLREDPDLAEAAAHEAAADPASRSDAEPGEDVFRELVQILGAGRPSDDLLLAEWREDFTKIVNRFSTCVTEWFPADTVAAKADDDLVKVVTYLADEVAQWAQTIISSRKPGLRLVESTTA